ncbi:MAG: 50S ribosomal protein L25 [Chloroflexi bacterium]|nr:50S ribosomal protein L25 [Chloroflexota bacterium]
MADKVVLEATRRELTGKQVRQLRAAGEVPGILYGPGFEPVPLKVSWVELRPALLAAGGSIIIDLSVDGAKYNALVRNVQRDPIRGDVTHIDFYRVRMDVAIRTEVPIVLEGDLDRFDDMDGTVIHELTSVMVECLPTDLPAAITVDISALKEIGDMILASDLPKLPGVSYLVNDEDVIVTTAYLRRAAEEAEAEGEGAAEPELVRRHEEEDEE